MACKFPEPKIVKHTRCSTLRCLRYLREAKHVRLPGLRKTYTRGLQSASCCTRIFRRPTALVPRPLPHPRIRCTCGLRYIETQFENAFCRAKLGRAIARRMVGGNRSHIGRGHYYPIPRWNAWPTPHSNGRRMQNVTKPPPPPPPHPARVQLDPMKYNKRDGTHNIGRPAVDKTMLPADAPLAPAVCCCPDPPTLPSILGPLLMLMAKKMAPRLTALSSTARGNT